MTLIVIMLSIILGLAGLLVTGLYLNNVSDELSDNFQFWNFFSRQEYLHRSQKIRDYLLTVILIIILLGVNIFVLDNLMPRIWLAVIFTILAVPLFITRKYMALGFLSILLLLPIIFLLEFASQTGLLGLLILISIILLAPALVRQFKGGR
ncbi:MAG: hypothetical protein COT81_01010 [Candidatus Buchananbacteria bacterium CG10_big_fil_rev_8_21_14_0_10_42_9]|uniref:Uncharacterized protein n=1 Tax=Candidatus Buchananbacteria bacterium CG10_big_fil_rev_8_21_14_0_10_42_9 TaxID=1974526 RepID=A0A2H0W4G1_9BACT|nr:MAG: hypothetical protein COT81_01010 [Candidatus Buchananbacteria bacterium CG10_big_fil_rev_8_21_14_0_10_42_9]